MTVQETAGATDDTSVVVKKPFGMRTTEAGALLLTEVRDLIIDNEAHRLRKIADGRYDARIREGLDAHLMEGGDVGELTGTLGKEAALGFDIVEGKVEDWLASPNTRVAPLPRSVLNELVFTGV